MQSGAWDAALRGKDLVAIDAPGSGKTLAYLLPAFLRVQAARAASKAPLAVVFVPSRELSLQVQKVRCHALQPCIAPGLPAEPRRRRSNRWQGCACMTCGRPPPSAQAASKVRREFGVSACAVHGGVSIDVHAEALAQQRPGILIATPGRARAMARTLPLPVSSLLSLAPSLSSPTPHAARAAERPR